MYVAALPDDKYHENVMQSKNYWKFYKERRRNYFSIGYQGKISFKRRHPGQVLKLVMEDRYLEKSGLRRGNSPEKNIITLIINLKDCKELMSLRNGMS